jgi:transcription termination factor Rho
LSFDLHGLEGMTVDQLSGLAKGLDVQGISKMKKKELIARLMEEQAKAQGLLFREGYLEVLPDGFGFLRLNHYLPSADDVYVAQSQVKRFGLRTGDLVAGQVRPPKDGAGERYYSLYRVESLNSESPDAGRSRIDFEQLTPIFPEQRLILETARTRMSTRVIDIVAPIGRGQRGLIVSPPKAGKTTLLKEIGNAIRANQPDVVLLVLLIDERPEEVTDIRRSVDGDVIASTFDELPENHIKAADMTLERAKRLVEHGKDVVILLDSITRFARASNLTCTPSGRSLSGGLDPSALHRPKRFLGAARNIENGGSLTILGTALIDTGSRMDDMIFEEFKATGNMELVLDRSLSEKKIFPAIDIRRSGTRHDELLFSREEMRQIALLLRALHALENEESMRSLIEGLKQTETNAEFLAMCQKKFRSAGSFDV